MSAAAAFSPQRIIGHLFAIPVVAATVAAAILMVASPYPPRDALNHVLALSGCETAGALGVAGARQGMPGYHARLDPDGDGIACAAPDTTAVAAISVPNGERTLRP